MLRHTHLWDNTCFILLDGSKVAGSPRRCGLDLKKPAESFSGTTVHSALSPAASESPHCSASSLSPRSCRCGTDEPGCGHTEGPSH